MEEYKQDAKPFFNAALVYRTFGNYLHKREKFDEAMQAYNQAHKYAAEDVSLLISRSHLCTDAFYRQQAFKDAEDALAIEPRNVHALNALSAASDLLVEFEKAIAISNRGLKRRPGIFREGINKGVSCINETIGKNAGDVMKHYLSLIKENAEIVQERNIHESKKHVSRIPPPKCDVKEIPLEVHKTELLSRVLAYKYLGPLAYDKFFLSKLVEDPRLESASKESNKRLKELVRDALQTLTERQSVLHGQCLYYTLQQKQTVSQHQNEFKKKLLHNEREMNNKQAQHFLRDIEASRIDNRLNDMMRKVTNMQNFFDAKTTYTFPDKNSYIDRLYVVVGEAFLSQNRLSYEANYQSNHRRVSFLMGLKSNRPTSNDSVRRNYPKRFGDPKVALQNALRTLETTENPNMTCWLYYEISQLQKTLKNHPLCKYYGQMCQKEAEKIGSAVWWLNGCFSLISSDVQQGNVSDVINLATDAYKWAKKTGKREETQQFLLHCIQLAHEVAEFHSAAHTEERNRRNAILNVMDKGLAKDTGLLFEKISRVPSKRQFSVLPKNQPKRLTMESERTKYEQKNLTIVPGPAKRIPPVAQSCVPGSLVIRN